MKNSIDQSNKSDTKIRIKTTVKVKDYKSKKVIEYTLVPDGESDISKGKIASTSPVGKGLLGRKENDIVEIKVPAGIVKYKIIKILK